MDHESIRGWKTSFAVGLGFGAGIAVTAALIVGSIAWYSSRPKPWDSGKIVATFSTPIYTIDEDYHITGTELEYTVENRTPKDFTLLPEQSLFLQSGGTLESNTTGRYKIAGPCFIPAKNKVKCQISVPADFEITTYGAEGFAIFDTATRYSILFPKPTGPTVDDRKGAAVGLQKMAEKSAHSKQTEP